MSGGRRASDRVSAEAALELVCTLAYEKAVAGGDDSVIDSVATAILKLRELVDTPHCKHCGEMPPGFECKHCGRLA